MKIKRAYNIVPYSTSRESRLNEMLSPKRVAVDGKNIEDYLIFISEYAKYINFYNLKNKKAGNWHALFAHNDIVFLSLLMQTDIRSLQERKNEIYYKCTQPMYRNLIEEHIKELQLFFTELIELLQMWFSEAKNTQEESIIYELKNAINNRLFNELKLVIVQDEKSENPPGIQQKLYKIYGDWGRSAEAGKIKSEHKDDSPESFTLTNDPEILGNACNVFLNSIRYILRQVPRWFQNTLEGEKGHTPHIGLLLTFLELHGHVKEQLNDLSLRHLDHYYRKLLQQKELAEKPDAAIVFFELAKEVKQSVLNKGTRLTAGQTEQGKEIIYRTLEDEELSNSKLTEIRTLFVSSNPIIAPLNKAELVTGIYTLSKTEAGKDMLNENPEPFHLFGTDPFGSLNLVEDDLKQPNIGCAIGAPVLAMKEGERVLSVAISFEKKSMLKLWEYIKTMALNSDYSDIEVLYHFFSSSFDLKLTGKEGWVTIKDYAIDFDIDYKNNYPKKIVFLFGLGKELPEITGFDPAIHQLNYNTHFPVLQIALQSNNTYYPYSLLKDMAIENIVINVSCEGIKDLQLYDVFGRLENNKPFEPFGPTPLKGESFYIGYEELAQKKLTEMVLDVEWYKLPPEGFEEYYKAYPGDINNDSFKISISALSQGEWTPKKEYRQETPMFEQEDNVLLENSTYTIDTEKIYYAPEFAKSDRPFNFDNAVNGFLKLDLEDPEMGFGQKAYQKIMTDNVYENINVKNYKKRKPFVVPESPFVPKMRSIRMKYSASQTINFNTSQEDRKADVFPFSFFHLQPFGTVKVASSKMIKEHTMVPGFDSRGYLHLGIANVHPNQMLSLYFNMTIKTDTNKDVDLGSIVWEYLSGTSWETIEREDIIKDDTMEFTNSGIVKLHVPENITHHHPLFSSSMFWLRISSSNTLDITRNCNYVNTQAVLVERDLDAATLILEDPLPKNTIAAVYDRNKDVKAVYQPFPSFGGHVAEMSSSFYNRVSERLFHKNRAVTAGDYERLILEQFPEIFQVSCLTSTLYPNEIKSNEIVIMILRDIDVNDSSSHRKFNITVLEKVKRFITALAPPSVKIIVRNPVYEAIRVSCEVKFKDNHLSGQKLKKLEHAINAHIAPWIYHKDRESEYKKHILHAKGIKNLIFRQDYVELVTNFSLVQFNWRGENKYTYRDTAVATDILPSKPWSVFVPADAHNIKLTGKHEIADPTPLKIGVMEIKDDFILQPEEQPEAPEQSSQERKDDDDGRIVLKVRL